MIIISVEIRLSLLYFWNFDNQTFSPSCQEKIYNQLFITLSQCRVWREENWISITALSFLLMVCRASSTLVLLENQHIFQQV